MSSVHVWLGIISSWKTEGEFPRLIDSPCAFPVFPNSNTPIIDVLNQMVRGCRLWQFTSLEMLNRLDLDCLCYLRTPALEL